MPGFFQTIARRLVRNAIKGARADAAKAEQRADPTWRGREQRVRDELAAAHPGARVEVVLPRGRGRADIVTSEEVIEVKEAKAWKAALGQVLVYADHFPGLMPRVHLFGPMHPARFKSLQKDFEAKGVRLTHQR